MNIVVHWHHVPPALVEAVGRGECPGDIDTSGMVPVFRLDSGDTLPLSQALTDADEAIAAMDAADVDAVTPSLAPPLTHYEVEPSAGLRVSKVVNDAFAQLAASYPGRYLPLANVPLQDPAAAVTELKRSIEELGLYGVAIGTNVNGKNLGEQEFRPFWRAVAELDTFVFLHPGPQTAVGITDRLRGPYLTNFVAFPVDTAAAIASLMFDGVYADVGPLKTCFAHGGGAFPFIASRWEHGYQQRLAASHATMGSPASHLGSVYCDSLTLSDPSLRFLIEVVGADHVMLGNDYPFN